MKEDIPLLSFPYTAAPIIDILQSSNKGPSLIKNNGNFRSLAISGEKAILLKSQDSTEGAILHLKCMMAIVGTKKREKAKVTVTVKDLSIKTWCLLHFLQASMGFSH